MHPDQYFDSIRAKEVSSRRQRPASTGSVQVSTADTTCRTGWPQRIRRPEKYLTHADDRQATDRQIRPLILIGD